jgi:hypothetical protein
MVKSRSRYGCTPFEAKGKLEPWYENCFLLRLACLGASERALWLNDGKTVWRKGLVARLLEVT